MGYLLTGYLSIHFCMVISASLNVYGGSGADVWAMDYSSSVEQNRKIKMIFVS